MKKSAKENGFELIIIRKGDQLSPTLNTAKDGQIKQLEYFGHSNAKDFLLEYSSDKPGQSTDYWGMTKGETADVRKGIFATGGDVNLYGCNLGESGGLAQDMKTKWGQKTTASDTKTDFGTTVGRDWKPTGNYKEIR
jgi:hypothetical protein